MDITFFPLQGNHCPLMLKWLNRPHVKKWWSDGLYTLQDIAKKYIFM